MKRVIQTRRSTPRHGFTLIELLIVISIIGILLTITLVAVNLNNEADRVKKGARQVQSFLLGAKDRAIQRGEEIGVRFYFNQPPAGADAVTTQIIARQVSGMAYIGRSGTWPPADESYPADVVVDGTIITDEGRDWWSLKRRGWLMEGMRVRIPNGPTGSWHQIVSTSTIDITAPAPAQCSLTLATSPVKGSQSYSIELPWSMLPAEPSILPENVVIDVDASRLPNAWRPAAGTANLYSSFIDVIFAPRGNVTADALAAGLLHFYVCDAEDSFFLKEQYITSLGGDPAGIAAFNTAVATDGFFVPMDELNATDSPWAGEYNVKPRRLVTVIPQTGSVSVHDVYGYIDPDVNPDPADVDSNGIADDPFRFAETGEASN